MVITRDHTFTHHQIVMSMSQLPRSWLVEETLRSCVLSAMYYNNCRSNGSTAFKLMFALKNSTSPHYHCQHAWTRLNNHHCGPYISYPPFRTRHDCYVWRNAVSQYCGFRTTAFQFRHIQLTIYVLSQWTLVMTFHHTRHLLDYVVWVNPLFRRSIKLAYHPS